MLNPCFAAMLDGAVMANNPPAGLTAVPQDGSNASSAINAIFAALPHAKTNTRNVVFKIPSARYKLNARVDIGVDGTAVLCACTNRSIRGSSSPYIQGYNNVFRGASLSPAVRMDNVEHVLWHGGGYQGRDQQNVNFGATQTFIEMGTTRFCVASCFTVVFCETAMQCNGLGAGQSSELCFILDVHWLNGWSTRPGLMFGTDNIRATSGNCRCCGAINFHDALASTGPTYQAATDCFATAIYSEFHNGSDPSAGELKSGCLRFVWMSGNIEGVRAPKTHAGASATAIGHRAWSAGAGEKNVFG